jgi:multiple sugar transport system substrate-binding protein
MAAMSWQGTWMIGVYGGDLGFNWDIATIPTNVLKYNTLHTGFFTISSTCKNPEAAWKIIEWMMGEKGQAINSMASGNPSALKTIAAKEEWKVPTATTVTNWSAMLDSLSAGVFGYTCLPFGVTENACSLFDSALLGQISVDDAIKQASDYAAETIGY